MRGLMRFEPGRICFTQGALLALSRVDVRVPVDLLRAHITGHYGDLDAHDRAINDRAVRDGSRILSQYTLASGERIWIITEPDRSATTFLLPDEY